MTTRGKIKAFEDIACLNPSTVQSSDHAPCQVIGILKHLASNLMGFKLMPFGLNWIHLRTVRGQLKEIQALSLPDGKPLLHRLTGMERGIILDDYGSDTGALKQALGAGSLPIYKPDVSGTGETTDD